ncbi:conserved hypothetical protein [Bacillus mycoides]|uniref:Uncharacterized protein n=1 Tax=Bacillus mycoides TaxID=1405 RepID=A0A654A7Z8_BACMY|nr:conserved hypothetical protein [Bacillus mycoides]
MTFVNQLIYQINSYSSRTEVKWAIVKNGYIGIFPIFVVGGCNKINENFIKILIYKDLRGKDFYHEKYHQYKAHCNYNCCNCNWLLYVSNYYFISYSCS